MNPKEISERLVSILHLETYPVAVKLYKDRAELPRQPLDIKQNFCQLISRPATPAAPAAARPTA